MGVDINIKYLEHPRHQEGEIEVASELEQIIQSIELVLYTSKGSVLGEEDFGASIADYLFSLNLDSRTMERSVTQELRSEIPGIDGYGLDVSVRRIERAADAIGVIEVKLNDKGTDENQAVKLQAIFR